MLNISNTKEENKLTVCLEGRLDTNTAPDLEEELRELLNDVEDLTLDFEKLDYISSAGLRVLLATYKVMSKQGEMRIVKINDTVADIFEVTGFADILTIE